MSTQWFDLEVQQNAQPHFLALSSLDLDHPLDQQKALQYVSSLGAPVIAALSRKNRMLSAALLNQMIQGDLYQGISLNLERINDLIRELDPKRLSLKNPGLMDRLFSRKEKYALSLSQQSKELKLSLGSLEKSMKSLRQDNITLDLERSELLSLYHSILPVQDTLHFLEQTFPQWIARHPSQRALAFVQSDLMEALERQSALFSQMELVSLQGLAAMENLQKGNERLLDSLRQLESVTMGAFWIALMLSKRQILKDPQLAHLRILNQQLDENLRRSDLAYLRDEKWLQDDTLSQLIDQADDLIGLSRTALEENPQDQIADYRTSTEGL